ncbi:MAG: glycoside hydrolase family 16 protein [Clostridiales bacterium]|nr:glycoside hydrolase family 16 protein [Clostridiales bacterium]
MADHSKMTVPDWNAPKIDLSSRRLVWQDEFDGDTLDLTKWKHIAWPETAKCDVTCNVYAADMVSVHDGCAWIRTEFRKEGPYGPGFYSGWISSENSLCTTYGYYEVRCKIPRAEGVHAAVWTFAKDHPYSDFGRGGTEVDIIESAACRVACDDEEQNSSYGITLHSGDESENHIGCWLPPVLTTKPDGTNLYDGFHTFGFEWTKTAYIFYYDGVEIQRVDFSKGPAGKIQSVCMRPEFIYLSMHVGSRIASDGHIIADWNGNAFLNPEGTFPLDFVVDYLRYYAPEEE